MRDEIRLAREQREQQQLESVGSNEKQSVEEGSAATPKNGGTASAVAANNTAEAMLLSDGTYRKDITRSVTRKRTTA